MIHKVILTLIGIVYESYKDGSTGSYKLAFFGSDGRLIHLIECPGLDYRNWQNLDRSLDTGVVFILVWKGHDGRFEQQEAEYVLNFIKTDQDLSVFDECECIRRSTLITRIICPNCMLVTWPQVGPPSYSDTWADFENCYRNESQLKFPF